MKFKVEFEIDTDVKDRKIVPDHVLIDQLRDAYDPAAWTSILARNVTINSFTRGVVTYLPETVTIEKFAK